MIIVLWVMGLVSLAIGGLVARSTHELRLGRVPLESLQRKAIAQAAVQQAMQVIAHDTQESPQRDSLQEAWATGLDGEGQPLFESIGAGDGSFSIGRSAEEGFVAGLIDEERKLNLRLAAPAIVQRLIERLGVEGSLPPADIAAALADWQDEPIGSWCNEAQLGYPCRNGLLQTLDELRLVPGMTPELFTALEPYVTVFGGAAPNVNTAEPLVLWAWGLTEDQIGWILSQRDTQPFDTDDAYSGLSVASTAFTVSVESWLSTTSHRSRVRAVIHRNGQILAWQPQ